MEQAEQAVEVHPDTVRVRLSEIQRIRDELGRFRGIDDRAMHFWRQIVTLHRELAKQIKDPTK